MSKSGRTKAVLGEVVTLLVGGAWGEDGGSNGQRVLRTNNIEQDFLLNLDQFATRKVAPNVAARLRMVDGDILMTKSNSIDRVGECGIFFQPGGDQSEYIPSNFCQLIRFDSEHVDPWFGLLLLRSPQTQRLIRSLATGTSASLKNISGKKLRELEFELPAISEQQRIVMKARDCFGRLEELRDTSDRTLRQAIGARGAALAAVFDSLTGTHPSTNIGSVTESSTYGTNAKCTATSQGVPVLRIPNIRQGYLDISDLKYAVLPPHEIRKTELQRGDLLIVRTNGSPELVGRCAVVTTETKYSFASYLIRFRLDLDKCVPEFLQFFLASTHGRDAIAKIRRTSAGQYNINSENIRSVEFPCPPVDVQRSIVERMNTVVGDIHDLIAQTEHGQARTEQLAKVILEKAFAGEL